MAEELIDACTLLRHSRRTREGTPLRLALKAWLRSADAVRPCFHGISWCTIGREDRDLTLQAPILVVARDGAECIAFEHVLRGLGPVQRACSGREALMRLGMTDFACLVIASPVPVEFGSEPLTLMELVERLAPNLASRVVIITDAHEMDVVQRARDAAVNEILLRPVEPADLRDAVARCLRHQSPARAGAEDISPATRDKAQR